LVLSLSPAADRAVLAGKAPVAPGDPGGGLLLAGLADVRAIVPDAEQRPAERLLVIHRHDQQPFPRR
jgi:hypothetical protein